MKNQLMAAFISLSSLTVSAQELLFESDAFSLYNDRVRQGRYEAQALSRNEIKSSYKSEFSVKSKRTITFKFALNGADNERYPGQDHHYTIRGEGGRDTSALFIFGQPDPKDAVLSGQKEIYLIEDTDLILRVDMRHVLNELNTKGEYVTPVGERIKKEDFRGVYVAGANEPLSWDFVNLPNKNEFRLTDENNDGIYEVTLHFKKEVFPGSYPGESLSWKLSRDISAYPSYTSSHIITDALFNMALEEMTLDIREDGAFMAGQKWPGVWTRDISYAILLSLAAVNPDASKVSLMAKVSNGRIIQDTGTGGAWPVSSDRMTWALAAWEIYCVTGDKEWLSQAYRIIKNSAQADMQVVRDKSTGLFRGESSFLDWREQSYPVWMEPRDIYESICLGTNAVHYQTNIILSKMARLTGESPEEYIKTAGEIKQAMNKYLWMNDKGYYGQYLYGRNYKSLSEKSEALGEALSVLFDIAPEEKQNGVIGNMPVTKFGVPSIYPFIPGQPPYHNNSVWPFVESFRAWASAKTGSSLSAAHSIASVYRPAALFLTNKENLVASTGDFLGTEINSDRQLWSVAGNLSIVFRVMLGMSFEENGLRFKPFIPESFKGERTLKNFRYRDAVLSVTVRGFGSKVKSFKVDGKAVKDSFIEGSLKGMHNIEIEMNGSAAAGSKVNFAESRFAPAVPDVSEADQGLLWPPVEGAAEYHIYRNGKREAVTKDVHYPLKENSSFSEYQVLSVDKDGVSSFLSEPLRIVPDDHSGVIQLEDQVKGEDTIRGFTGNGYVRIEKGLNEDIQFAADILSPGEYTIEFLYSNGNGPVNTENKCAVRSLFINGVRQGSVILPQRGIDEWSNWGYSSAVSVKLEKGSHKMSLKLMPFDNNMNFNTNTALLDCVRITRVK